MERQETGFGDGLLEVAHRVFSEEGFGVSTKHIARSAEIRESALFERFPTKGDLFLEAMAPPTEVLEEYIRQLDSGGDLRGELGTLAVRLFAYLRELSPILFVLATDLEFDYREYLSRRAPAPQACLQEALVNFLKTHEDSRHIDPDDMETAVLNLFSTLHSLAFFEALGAFGGDCPEEIIRDQAALLYRGLMGSVA